MKMWSTLLLRGGLTSSAIVFALLVGCQGQHEGERCSLLNGNADCVGDLVCTAASSLRADDGVNRCCSEGTPTDDRCLRRISGGNGSGGGGGLGGSSSTGGDGSTSGGSSSGGAGSTVCRYNSDCPRDAGLVCGPGGVCQAECQDDIDCNDGLVCNDEKRCVSAT